VSLVAVGVAVLVLSLVALGPKWWRVGLVGEWGGYLLVALAILSWLPFRSALARTGRGSKAAVVTCFLLLALGQFLGGGRQAFPLSRFQMFTDPAPSVAHQYRYVGVSTTGRTVAVDPVRLFPSLDRGRFDGKLIQTAQAAIQGGPGSGAAETYDGILTALLERYNANARDKLARLEVYTVDAPLDPPPRDRVAVEATRVWSVGVAP
jgi:hypothetical protein